MQWGVALAAVNYKMVQSGIWKGTKSYKICHHLSVNLSIRLPPLSHSSRSFIPPQEHHMSYCSRNTLNYWSRQDISKTHSFSHTHRTQAHNQRPYPGPQGGNEIMTYSVWHSFRYYKHQREIQGGRGMTDADTDQLEDQGSWEKRGEADWPWFIPHCDTKAQRGWELGELLSIATCRQRMIVRMGHRGRRRDDCVHHRSNNGRDYKEQAHTDTQHQ